MVSLTRIASIKNADRDHSSLQELGDWRQILRTGKSLQFLPHCSIKESTICERMDDCVKKITVQAQTHQTQGRYKDAEYLYRQLQAASAPLDPSDDGPSKPELDMVLIYEKLGNLPAAEILQEHRLRFSMSPEQGPEDAIISREAENLFRLYVLFVARVEDLNIMSTASVLLKIFYRIALRDCSLLNAMLFKSELWAQYDHELCLHIAIRIQATEMIRGMISIGVDINRSGDGWSPPLLTAARYGNLDSLKLLLENNVDVGAKSVASATALHIAMYRGPEQRDETYEIIRRLIEAGADFNAADSNLRTPLHSAMYWGLESEEEVIYCLIHEGANIDLTDNNKETVLHVAVRRGLLTTVKLLLQGGADTEVGENQGETPLFYAIRYAHESMVELLLDHDANIEAQKRGGCTPLHHAVKYKQIEIVGILLKRGAIVTAEDDLYQTPVDIARLGGDQILVDMLLAYKK